MNIVNDMVKVINSWQLLNISATQIIRTNTSTNHSIIETVFRSESIFLSQKLILLCITCSRCICFTVCMYNIYHPCTHGRSHVSSPFRTKHYGVDFQEHVGVCKRTKKNNAPMQYQHTGKTIPWPSVQYSTACPVN